MKKFGLISLWLLLTALLLSPAGATLADMGIIPLQTDVAGRPLGMGGAFVGLADDVHAAFYNPAGLAWNKGVSVTARDSYNITAVQAYPNGNNAAAGLAIITTRLSHIPYLTTQEADFNNTTIYLSLGGKLNFLPRLEENSFFQRFALGLNIKGIVNQTLRCPGQLDRSATGWNADFGLLWRPQDWLSVGATWQNLLQTTAGGNGSIKWDIGSSESMPTSLRLGGAIKLIGEIGTPVYIDGQELLFATEVDANNDQSLWRVGGEYGLFKTLYVRTGWQQLQSSTGLTSDLTYGLGYRNELWGCDFSSYREPSNNQRYTTLSLLYFPADWIVLRSLDIERPQVMLENPIESISLRDNIVTYDDKIEVSGRVKPGVTVYINGSLVALDENNAFKTIVPLRLKKNLIVVEARYRGEKKIWTYKVFRKARVYVPDAALSKNASEKKEKVENLVTMGVIDIKPESSFVMESGITRGELASWLVKSTDLQLPEVQRDLFSDVPKDHPMAQYIKVVVDLGLMKPYTDGTFRPDATVSKKEGDAIFAKFGAMK